MASKKKKVEPEIKNIIDEWVKGKVAYKISPKPFLLLSHRDRERIISNFESYLNALSYPVMIIVKPVPRKIIIDDTEYSVLDYNYFIITDKEAPEPSNFQIEKKYDENGVKAILTKPYTKIISEKPDKIIFKTKRKIEEQGIIKEIEFTGFAKSYVMYSLGYEIVEAIIVLLAELVDSIAMIIEPIPAKKALSYLPVARERIENAKKYSNDIYISRYEDMLEILYERVKRGEKMHRFTLIITLSETQEYPDEPLDRVLERLKSYETEMIQLLKENFIEVNSPLFLQKMLFYYNTKGNIIGNKIRVIKPIYTDSYTLAAFYPFVSDEIRDPDGVFIGINPLTGGPITYNPLIHRNKNIVILGDTGSGKSMTTKVLIRRLLMKHPEMYLYILDPEGEYAYAKHALGDNIVSIDINPDMELGLDPLRMYARGMLKIERVIQLLSELFDIRDRFLVNLKEDIHTFIELKEKEGKKDEISVPSFVEYVINQERYKNDKEIQANYIPSIKLMNLPPAKNIFAGELPEFGKRVIFNLREVQDSDTKKIIGSLISAYLYYQLMTKLPEEIPKLFVVDEAWIFSQYRSVMKLFEDISRRGRKRTIIFMFVTQRPFDVLATPEGRSVVELAETTLLLGMQEKSIHSIVENNLYNLTENDIEYLKSASRGAGILRIGDIKTPIQVKVTPKELEAFETEKFKAAIQAKE